MVGVNAIGELQRWRKIERARERHKWELSDQIMEEVNEVQVYESEGKAIAWGPPKTERLIKCFNQIAMALYFHAYGAVFQGEIKSQPGFLSKLKGNIAADADMTKRLFDRDLKNTPVLGANPAVFSYQFAEPDRWGLTAFRFIFYGKVPVYGTYIPAGVVVPKDPLGELIAAGIPTAIGFKDGLVWFNRDDSKKK